MSEDEGTKALLKKTFDLAKENNRLLRKMRRAAIIGNIMRLVWFAIIIGVPIALYYYVLQPYIQQFGATYADIAGGVDEFKNLPGIELLFGTDGGDTIQGSQ